MTPTIVATMIVDCNDMTPTFVTINKLRNIDTIDTDSMTGRIDCDGGAGREGQIDAGLIVDCNDCRGSPFDCSGAVSGGVTRQ